MKFELIHIVLKLQTSILLGVHVDFVVFQDD